MTCFQSIETERLLLKPFSVSDLQAYIRTLENPELRQAYREMLQEAIVHPDEQLFCLPWKILLKDDGTYVGDLGFKGGPVKGAVEIGYGLEKEYEGHGYMTEAVFALTEWAFSNNDVRYIDAETAPNNRRSQKILEKNGFTANGEGEEGPRFRKSAPHITPEKP